MKRNIAVGPDGRAAGHGGRNTTGRRSPELWIYGAQRRGCPRCRGRVMVDKQAQGRGPGAHFRTTYWCPRCQPALA